MTFGALFAGIGGIDLGLERAGLVCRWQIEIDPFCNRVLEKHWPGVKRYADIRTVTGDELEPVDLMCGGFPCQDLSQAGKRAGIEGTRSSLWFEFARLVGKLRPRYVLVENVAGLLVYDGIRRVIGELARLGYVGLWRSLRASEFGAAHLRKRVFILAYRECERSERWGDAGILEGAASREHREGLQRQRNGHAANDSGNNVAYREHSGRGRRRAPLHCNGRNASGYGKLREPSELKGGFINGSHTTLGTLSDTSIPRLPYAEQIELSETKRNPERGTATELCGAFAPGPADSSWPAILRARPDLAPALADPNIRRSKSVRTEDNEEAQSPLRGMVDGIPDWLDGALSNRTKRLGRLGNAVVPQIAEWIGRRILEFERRVA